MNHITDANLLAHTLELRLLVAVMVLPVTYAAIQFASFVARHAGTILAKFNNFGAASVATGKLNAAGAR